MSEEKSPYNSKSGPLGPENFENGERDITPEDLAKAYGVDFMKEMADFTEEVKRQSKASREKTDGSDKS
jgi:hypothetical protein